MSTTIRPNISSKKRYWISKERYYELKHFCMQYKEWKKLYLELSEASFPGSVVKRTYRADLSDLTSEKAIILCSLHKKMALVEDTAKKADIGLWNYIFEAVTENRSYVYLDTVMHIPCSKDLYYDRYRKFFWLLSFEKD